ncbi:MAG TPA: hypothetical protein VHC45_08985 [Gaiellaceae bacterium]|jgi:hypothetical protein|nr:hypothetical protein [Gaiellaceae bacterium]
MTTPIEPIQPRVTPPTPARRVDRTSRDPQRDRGGRHDLRDEQAEDEPADGEDPGVHVDVLA